MGQQYFKGDTMPHGARKITSSIKILYVDRSEPKLHADLVHGPLFGDFVEMDEPNRADRYLSLVGMTEYAKSYRGGFAWYYIPGTRILIMIEPRFSRIEVMGSDWDWHDIDDEKGE